MKICYAILLFAATLLIPGNLFAQQKTGKSEYKPEPGQEGKNVRWFPTPQELVDKMLDMAKIMPSDFLIDLGSGDGRTVITAAKRGLHAIGIEYNPDLVELSKRNAMKEGVQDMVEFIKTDLFEYDFSKATVVTLFLLPEINLRLRPRLLDLKPGTRIVSTTFTMQTWQHDGMVKIEDKSSSWNTAYLWVVPAKVAGTWTSSGLELNLTQQFQMVSGTLMKDGKKFPVTAGRLNGTNLTFSAGGTNYSCIVSDNLMKGTAREGNTLYDWAAKRQGTKK